jgi:hypothetical protein
MWERSASCGAVRSALLSFLCHPPPAMAAVHPSRAHLVPQGQRHGSDLSSRGRPASPPPRRRHSPGRERSASPRQDYDRGGHREKERSRERASERERRDRDGPPDRDGRGDDRGRRRSASRERDGARRRSPEYSEYRRPPPEDRRDAAPHQAGSMYPSRGVGGGYGSTGNSGYAGNAGGGDYAERYGCQICRPSTCLTFCPKAEGSSANSRLLPRGLPLRAVPRERCACSSFLPSLP